MPKRWRPWPAGECPECGDSLEIETTSEEHGLGYDSDEVRCVACRCPGQLNVYAEDAAEAAFGYEEMNAWHERLKWFAESKGMGFLVSPHFSDHAEGFENGRGVEVEYELHLGAAEETMGGA